MKPHAARTPDPRQRTGLHLATPRRVRLEVDACPWELLPRDERSRAHRPARGVTLEWVARTAGEGPPLAVAYVSSPVDRHMVATLRAALGAQGLPDSAIRAVDAFCWEHVARVAYPDGTEVAFGLTVAPRSVGEVEAAGFPFARLEGQTVRPWAGCVHGHTDAEVRAAERFVREPSMARAEGATP